MHPIRHLLATLAVVALAFACQSNGPASPDEPAVVRIELSASALAIGPDLDVAAFDLANRGEVRVEWRVESISTGWMSVDPGAGALDPGQSTRVAVEISRDGLARGTHQGTIRIIAGDRTFDVTVSLEHPGAPHAALDPGSIDLGPDDSTAELRVRNTGDAPLEWTLSAPGWVGLEPASGRTDPGGEERVTVVPDRSALSAGTHTTVVSLDSDGGDATTTLTVAVPAPARLRIDPGDLDFGSTGTARTLTVINDGELALDWSADPGTGWITVEPGGGTVSPTGSQAVVVRIARSGLSAGTHQATLGLQSNGGTASVGVRLQVPAPPQDGGSDGGSDGGGSDGGGDPNDDSGTVALEGQILGQFTRSGVAGATVRFDGQTIQADGDGRFRLEGTASNDLRSLGLSGNGLFDRGTFARTGDSRWLVIPRSFDMAAFDDMAREYEPRTIRWVEDPDVYFDVTPPAGFPPGSELDVWIAEVRDVIASFISDWTNGEIRAARLTVGTSPPRSGTPGTIVIGFSEDSDTYNGPNTVGLARTYWMGDRSIYAARIWLRFGLITGPSRAWVRTAVVGHELGHALGLGHMDGNTQSLMTPSISTSDLSSFDRQAGNVLYTRSPGNTSPDHDSSNYYRGALTAAVGGTHEWICGPGERVR